MSEIFVSYARSTERQAVAIEAELCALGYSVWRDDQLPTHRPYGDVLEERVKAAKAVVVIWSSDALKSDWVPAEADAARIAGKLVQLSLDGPAIMFDVAYNRAMIRDVRFVRLCAKLGLCDYWLKSDCWPDCAEVVAPDYDFKAEARRLAS